VDVRTYGWMYGHFYRVVSSNIRGYAEEMTVKTEWWDAGVVICLGRGADLHMAQPMPLPLTNS